MRPFLPICLAALVFAGCKNQNSYVIELEIIRDSNGFSLQSGPNTPDELDADIKDFITYSSQHAAKSRMTISQIDARKAQVSYFDSTTTESRNATAQLVRDYLKTKSEAYSRAYRENQIFAKERFDSLLESHGKEAAFTGAHYFLRQRGHLISATILETE